MADGGGAFGLAAGPAVVGAGSSPALSFAASTELPLGGGALLLVNADGFCQNNEAQNKAAAAPGLCGLTSNPGTKGVLVYSYGELSAFEAALRRGQLMSAW